MFTQFERKILNHSYLNFPNHHFHIIDYGYGLDERDKKKFFLRTYSSTYGQKTFYSDDKGTDKRSPYINSYSALKYSEVISKCLKFFPELLMIAIRLHKGIYD